MIITVYKDKQQVDQYLTDLHPSEHDFASWHLKKYPDTELDFTESWFEPSLNDDYENLKKMVHAVDVNGRTCIYTILFRES